MGLTLLSAAHQSLSHEDFISALRLVEKLLPILQRKGKNAVVTYFALKMLLIDLEADYGFFMAAEDERELKAFLESLEITN